MSYPTRPTPVVKNTIKTLPLRSVLPSPAGPVKAAPAPSAMKPMTQRAARKAEK